MQKRILALALAVILIAASFAGCGKKKNMVVSKDGKEYEAVINDNGHKIYNQEGNVAVYEKDDNGKYVKNDKGEKTTMYVIQPDEVFYGQTYENNLLAFTMKDKSWELVGSGRFAKKDTEGQVYIAVTDLGGIPEGFVDVYTYANDSANSKENVALREALTEQGMKMETTVEKVTVTSAMLPAAMETSTIFNADGSVRYYAAAIVFLHDAHLLHINYVCGDMKFYDENVNPLALVNDALYLK